MLTSVPINNGLAPNQVQGPRCTRPITFNCPFQANNQPMSGFFNVDLQMEDAEGSIDNIQTLFFDTAQCNSNVYLVFQNTGQRLVLPMKSQGYLPIACGNEVRLQYGIYEPGGAGYAFSLQFFNVPIAPFVWSTTEKLRVFCRPFACPAAGGSVSTAGGVNLLGLINPGIDFGSAGTQTVSLGATQTPTVNSQAFGCQILGFDILVQGSADTSQDKFGSFTGLVTGWGPVNNNQYMFSTNANGNAWFQWRAPPPGVFVAGFNMPSISVPAVTTPTLYQGALYYTLQ